MSFHSDLTNLLMIHEWDMRTGKNAVNLADEIESSLQSQVIVQPEPTPDPEVESPPGAPNPNG